MSWMSSKFPNKFTNLRGHVWVNIDGEKGISTLPLQAVYLGKRSRSLIKTSLPLKSCVYKDINRVGTDSE